EPGSRPAPERAGTPGGGRRVNPRLKKEWTISLGETAEVLAERYRIGRAEQDAFALESQRRAAKAQQDCAFTDEIVPVSLPDGSHFTKDEYPRPDSSAEKLAAIKPAFRKDGTVTAGSPT